MVIEAYFDGCYVDMNESYIGTVLVYSDGSKEETCIEIDKKVKNPSEVELLALVNLIETIKQKDLKKVRIYGDFEQLISRINKFKKGIENKSHTLTKGFENSSQYKIIEILMENSGWSIEKIINNKNIAHDVSRIILEQKKKIS